MQATFSERKLQFIQKIVQLENEDLFSLIEMSLFVGEQGDWAETLTEAERKAIVRGLNDLDEGKTEQFDDFEERSH